MNKQIPDEGLKHDDTVEYPSLSSDTDRVKIMVIQSKVESQILIQGLPELTPEQYTMVMNKVQDIDKDGVAFTVTELEHCESIFRNGILGNKATKNRKIVTVEKWKKDARQNRAVIFFNIVGRMQHLPFRDLPGVQIAQSRYFPTTQSLSTLGYDIVLHKDVNSLIPRIAIIFDVSKFPELVPISHVRSPGLPRTYRIDASNYDNLPSFLWDRIEKYDHRTSMEDVLKDMRDDRKTQIQNPSDIKVDSEYGFITHNRVPPRLFKGIVVNEKISTNPDILEETIQQIRKANHQREHLLVPIYDYLGNLLWPKKMSHKEVVLFLAQRDLEKDVEL